MVIAQNRQHDGNPNKFMLSDSMYNKLQVLILIIVLPPAQDGRACGIETIGFQNQAEAGSSLRLLLSSCTVWGHQVTPLNLHPVSQYLHSESELQRSLMSNEDYVCGSAQHWAGAQDRLQVCVSPVSKENDFLADNLSSPQVSKKQLPHRNHFMQMHAPFRTRSYSSVS